MSGVKGRQFGETVYAPDSVSLGAIAYVGQGAQGLQVFWLEYPAGAALGDYVAVTGDDGVLVWVLASTLLIGTGMVPTYIGPTETFTVPADRQALFALTIVNDGTLVITGDLVMVS